MRFVRDSDWASLKRFKKSEFRFPDKLAFEALEVLDQIAIRATEIAQEERGAGNIVRVRITSDFRSPTHNESVGGAKKSAHTEIPNTAFDIAPANGFDRWCILNAAFQLGYKRLGVYENGSIHVDLSVNLPGPTVWTKV